MAKEQAQIRFSEATQRWNREREKLQAMEQKHEEQVANFRAGISSPMPLETFKFYRYSFDKLKEELEGQQRRVEETRAVQQQCLAELGEAAKRLEVVSNLKKMRWEQHQQAAIAEEQQLLDEVGILRHGREF